MSQTGKNSEKRYKCWFFTHNNPDEQNGRTILLGRLAQLKCNAIFQLESGENNTRHWQGVIRFTAARGFTSVRKVLSTSLPGAHWERCRSWKDAVKYCSKADTRVDGPWIVGDVPYIKPSTDFFIEEKASWWQQAVLSHVSSPVDRRKLVWVHEPRGGVGKSTLARHLIGFKYPGTSIAVRGSHGDILYAVKQHLDTGKLLWLLVVDIPRANTNKVSYVALEDVGNGLIFSTKYESGHAVFDPPHRVVFSNYPPDLTQLSADRWLIIDATSEVDIQPPPEIGRLDVTNYLSYP